MKTQPIIPARIDFSDPAAPLATDYGDVYHSRAGALAQAGHVFLKGNGLPQRWQGRERFVVLETGFGLGNNFLATWAAWRADPLRCRRLHFISIEKHPLRREDLVRAHAASALPELARALCEAWPPLTPNVHPLWFDAGGVQLLLALGDVHALLPEIVAKVDAFFLDGFAPSKNPDMWDRRLFKAIGRLAAPGATAATWSVARDVRDGLQASGFAVERATGFSGKRDMTVARFAPAFTPRRAPSRQAASPGERKALVIGAGLAGASAAWALADEGFACTVLDRHGTPAQEASGNPAGLFHGIVNAHDGPHARAHRAAALVTARTLRPWLDQGVVEGRIGGLLRLGDASSDPALMQTMLDKLGLPAEYVRAMKSTEASALAGVPLAAPAWHYPQGGWVAPGSLARHWLDRTGVRFVGNAEVAKLRRSGERWQALDAHGNVLDDAPVVVLACAHDMTRLLDQPAWPLTLTRGQLSLVPAGTPGLRAPVLPLAGAGYALTLPNGTVMCGATQSEHDEEPSLRVADHEHNLGQLARLTGSQALVDASALDGRVGWRVQSPDRLPLAGAVPLPRIDAGTRVDQPRFVPREAGLFVFTALGSRGLTWTPLCARMLAAWVADAPLPLEASLVDALDPARFVSRAARIG